MPRLVLFELHHLGDATLALPFLRGARTSYETTVVCPPNVADFLGRVITGIEIIVAPPSWSSLALSARRMALLPTDAAASVWPDARVHLLMFLSGAGVRVGFPMSPHNYYAAQRPWRQKRLMAGNLIAGSIEILSGHPLLTRPLERANASQSHLANWEQLANALGIQTDYSLPWIYQKSTKLPKDANDFQQKHKGKVIILIHPGGRLPTKRWPVENFQQLLSGFLARENVAVLIIQPPGENAPMPVCSSQMLVQNPEWDELVGLFQQSDIVLANDSFPAHLAAALGKTVVTVFGSGSPDWFAPYGNAQNVVATETCKFRPCVDHCVMPSLVCLESIDVKMVESRLREAINRG